MMGLVATARCLATATGTLPNAGCAETTQHLLLGTGGGQGEQVAAHEPVRQEGAACCKYGAHQNRQAQTLILNPNHQQPSLDGQLSALRLRSSFSYEWSHLNMLLSALQIVDGKQQMNINAPSDGIVSQVRPLVHQLLHLALRVALPLVLPRCAVGCAVLRSSATLARIDAGLGLGLRPVPNIPDPSQIFPTRPKYSRPVPNIRCHARTAT